MRPDFGCGLLDLVFAPSSPELAARSAVRARRRCSAGSATSSRSTALDDRRRGPTPCCGSSSYRVRATGDRRDDVFEGRAAAMTHRHQRAPRQGAGRPAERRRRRRGRRRRAAADRHLPRQGPATDLGPENIRIDGGRRVTGITRRRRQRRTRGGPGARRPAHDVTVDRAGDTSPLPALARRDRPVRAARHRAVPRLRPALRRRRRSPSVPAARPTCDCEDAPGDGAVRRRSRARHRLHRPRLRQHPPAAAGPAGADQCRLDRAQRPRPRA